MTKATGELCSAFLVNALQCLLGGAGWRNGNDYYLGGGNYGDTYPKLAKGAKNSL